MPETLETFRFKIKQRYSNGRKNIPQKWKLFLVAKFSRGDNKCCMSNCNEVSKTEQNEVFPSLRRTVEL